MPNLTGETAETPRLDVDGRLMRRFCRASIAAAGQAAARRRHEACARRVASEAGSTDR
jgi:hypothetical protein